MQKAKSFLRVQRLNTRGCCLFEVFMLSPCFFMNPQNKYLLFASEQISIMQRELPATPVECYLICPLLLRKKKQ
jgi:hypothetical protein